MRPLRSIGFLCLGLAALAAGAGAVYLIAARRYDHAR